MTKRLSRLHQIAQFVNPNGGCSEAWFYENPKSIDVYCHRYGENSRWCRIPLAKLADYVRRAKAHAKRTERRRRK